jgi:hypothetical protein
MKALAELAEDPGAGPKLLLIALVPTASPSPTASPANPSSSPPELIRRDVLGRLGASAPGAYSVPLVL